MALMEEALDAVMRETGVGLLIHGGAKGADTFAEMWAREHAVPYLAFPAQWHIRGRAAGPERNQRMLDVGKPDRVLAFHRDLENAKGTGDMVRRARAAGIEVVHVGGDTEQDAVRRIEQ
jgi:hypothetical protein